MSPAPLKPIPMDVTVKIERLDPDNVKGTEVDTILKRAAGLQVKLTRLPDCILKLFKDAGGKMDAKTASDLGLHSEIDIKAEPFEEFMNEPQDRSVDYDDAVHNKGSSPPNAEREIKKDGVSEENATITRTVADTNNSNKANNITMKTSDLGLHSEIDIKAEPFEEFMNEPQDLSVDYDDAVHNKGSSPLNAERGIKKDGVSEENATITRTVADTNNSNKANNITMKSEKFGTKYVKTMNTNNLVKTSDNQCISLDKKSTGNQTKITLDAIKNTSLNLVEEYLCTICDYKAKRESYLKYHMQAHSASKSFTCDLCSYITTDRKQLINHLRIHTGDKPYACIICDRKFAHKSALKNHLRIHTGDKPHACKICDIKFAHKSTLKSHLRVHTGEKLHACKICDKKFADKSTLKSHLRVHTGEKPYTCDICDKKLSTRSSFMTHVRIHTGEKPYSCNICDRKFSHRCALNYHITIHTGEKPYACTICDKKFSQSSDLHRHTRRQHTL